MEYFIGQIDRDWSDDRFEYKGGENPARKRKGYIPLFDRNTRRFVWFKILEICQTKFGWIVERKSLIPTYWRNSIEGNSKFLRTL